MNIISAALSPTAVGVIPGVGARRPSSVSGTGKTSSQQLTSQERKEVTHLKRVDRKVRAHEQAHVAAGGQYVQGGANFEYTTGPDGKRYAVGGEVSIDTSPVKGDPQATIRKMRTVRQAALAPAEPSGQDRQVAAKASQNEMEARKQLRLERSSDNMQGTAKADAAGQKSVPTGYTNKAMPQYISASAVQGVMFDISG